jgi:hypothetical protein
MSTEEPKRGDLVYYRSNPWFFQPNGTACFLYKEAKDIGHPARAIYQPGRSAVTICPPGTKEQTPFHFPAGSVPDDPIYVHSSEIPRSQYLGEGWIICDCGKSNQYKEWCRCGHQFVASVPMVCPAHPNRMIAWSRIECPRCGKN